MHISIADLADGAADQPLLDPEGGVRDPLAVVGLGPAEPGVVERAVRRARECDRILVGVGSGDPRLARALDLTFGPGGRETVAAGDLDGVREAAARNPRAALMLRDVLRTTESLPVHAALDVESYAYSALLGGAEFAGWLSLRGPRPLPPEAAEPVLVTRDGDRLSVTLNRPERRNAFGRQLRDALVDALTVAIADEDVTLVLRGEGPAFCSGGDLDEFGTAPDLATAHLVRTRGGAGRLIHRLAGRIEVRAHGPCVGAGIELPAFAGRVTARPDTTFRLPEVSMGLIPGAGGTVSIPRRIGRWRTLYMALTGIPVDTGTALAWGLIDEISSAAE
ncbi:enoyl-CoA hydratase/isomerase family protein [Actinomadura sp. 7K507]|uniref:enoyl-CoA hydratase/isomerase family protein n=1 Tax=Actinomadura sp. 7K507 TaxID=2530365 RepID=UPI001A9D5E00|nr:enoyl-CoA hydratase/isomerase family protein [Actinomadura sp. 7K507]